VRFGLLSMPRLDVDPTSQACGIVIT
jgi:hypothetical protein